MLMGFLCEVRAQSSALQLRKYCVISQTAEYVLENAGNRKSPLLSIAKLAENKIKRELIIDYTYHRDIPLDNVANDVWLLVAKQLNGEQGKLLTTGMANYLLTANHDGEWTIVLVMWNSDWKKWVLASVDVKTTYAMKKGSRSINYIEQ